MSRVQLLSINDLRAMREPAWLLEGYLHKGDVGVIYGQAASGKSFLALDWALSLAADLPWLSKHPVDCSPVLYMAGEGGPSMFKRIDAWMDAHDVHYIPNAYFHLEPLPLREEEAIQAIEDTLAAFHHGNGEYGLYPGLIVIDTLSQFFSGGDEVSPDMTQFVTNMRRIARSTGATVLIVHHTNKGGKDERGHTSLRCNVEVMLRAEALRTDHRITGILLTNDKQKDDPEAAPVTLDLVPSLTSLVIVEGIAIEKTRGDGLPKIPDVASMRAWLAGQPDGATWREWMLGARVPKTIFNRRVRKMKTLNEIYKSDIGHYHMMPALEDLAEDDDE